MSRRDTPWPALLPAAASVALTFAATEGNAQEFCVACTGPAAVYRCVIDNAMPTGSSLKLLCISTMARNGGHETCQVKGGTVFDCAGPVRHIDARGGGPLNPTAAKPVDSTATPGAPGPQQGVGSGSGSAGKATSTAAAPGQPPAKPQSSGTPQTVEELAKQMSKSSGDGLGKAGTAISGTTKKIWGCISSLFTAC